MALSRCKQVAALMALCVALSANGATDVRMGFLVDELHAWHGNPTVDVRMGFVVQELHALHGKPHFDTLGIKSGASDAIDGPWEVDYPPTPDGVFDAHWLAADGTPRTDLRSPPTFDAPPFVVDYVLEFQLSLQDDSLQISWGALPAGIDSIHIEDSLPGTKPGTNFQVGITRLTPTPDSCVLLNPPPPGVEILHLRMRVYYSQSVATSGSVRDSLGILTGASAGWDPTLETSSPNRSAGEFNARWIIGDSLSRLDLRPPPRAAAPPFAVEYLLTFELKNATDTVMVGWNEIPAEIDSFMILDSAVGVAAGTFLNESVSHSQSAPTKVLWANPSSQEPHITQFLVRVFYNRSVAGIHTSSSPLPMKGITLYPCPAHGRVGVAGQAIPAGSRLAIYDVGGALVRTLRMTGSANGIDVSGLPAGIYSVHRLDSSGPQYGIFIVE